MLKSIILLALLASLALVMAAPLEQDEFFDDDSSSNEITEKVSKSPNFGGFLPNEDDNVVNLVGSQELFKDFCQEARQIVADKLDTERNNLKSSLFNVLFNSLENVAGEMMDSEHLAKTKLTEQLRNPKQPVQESDNPDEIQQLIDNGAKSIHEQTNKSDVLATSNTVIKVLFARARQVLANQANKVQQRFNVQSSLSAVNEGCIRFKSEYLNVVVNLFKTTKSNLLDQEQSKTSPDQDVVNGLESIQRPEQLRCGITKRLFNTHQFCQFYQATSPIVLQMIQNNN